LQRTDSIADFSWCLKDKFGRKEGREEGREVERKEGNIDYNDLKYSLSMTALSFNLCVNFDRHPFMVCPKSSYVENLIINN
jgi:hypothetical protein